MADAAGAHYAALIKEALDQERARKESLEKRAEWVVASSGTIVTLLLGLSAFVAEARETLPLLPKLLVVLALGSFLVGGILAIAINRPTVFHETAVEGLRGIVDEPRFWAAPELIGLRRTAENRLAILTEARPANRRKAVLLKRAMKSQMTGVGLVALAIVVVLLD